MQWYRIDFGGSDGEVLRTLSGYMAEGGEKRRLEELLKTGKFKIKYGNYDWGNNAATWKEWKSGWGGRIGL